MTLAQYLRILREQWWIVALLTLVGVGGATFVTLQQTPVYSATTQLFVSTRTTDSTIAQMSQGSSFIQQRVKSYSDIATSPDVLEPVVEKLALPITANQLAGQVTVDSPPDTVLLNVTVRNPDAKQAAAIANEIARELPVFVVGIETPTGDVRAPVKISVTDTADVPGAPVSPRKPLNLALGLLIGLALGLGCAVLRDQLNTAVGGVSDVERLTGAIPLGVVPFDSSTKTQPLVDTDEQSGRAEAFRTLRTNLQFADVDNPPRVIVVTSPLPNEGKTTSACNIALTLALGGARVVLVDGDLRKPKVGAYLGLDGAAGLSSVLAGRHELRDVIATYGRDILAVLPSGPTPPNPSELLSSQHMTDLVTTLANHYDVVVIDAPPLLPVTDAAVLTSIADGAVLVLRYGRTRREEAQRALQALGAVNAKLLGTVLNFAPKRKRRGGAYDGYGYGYGYGTPADAQLPAPAAPDAAVPEPAEPVLASSRITLPPVSHSSRGDADLIDVTEKSLALNGHHHRSHEPTRRRLGRRSR